MASIHQTVFQQISPPTKLFIDNEFCDAADGSSFPVVNPSTEEVICHVSHAHKADVDRAVACAKRAFPIWSTMDPLARAKVLFKIADLLEAKKEDFGRIEALNTGKSIEAARDYDVTQAATIFRYYAGWIDKLPLGEVVPSDAGHQVVVTREACGIVGCIVPWNFPIMITAWKLAPALAVGCCAVLKPSELTPLTALMLAVVCKEAGMPAGVLNVVPGLGPTAGEAITTHDDIDKVTFTGSTAVGRRVLQAAAMSNLKKVTLELGGKSPNVVFDDCDFDEAVAGACQALFLNTGENCCAGSRLYVQETIYDKFVEALRTKVQNIHVGDPFDPATSKAAADGKLINGALINKAQFEKVLGYVTKGNKEGARLVTGGRRLGEKGFYVEPTVFADVTDNMAVCKEEIFGPILVVSKFTDFEDALTKANGSPYGLAAAVWTKDMKKMNAFVSRVKAGVVWTNTYNIVKYNAPFGGVKTTGFGRDLGKDALFEYMSVKSVVSKL